MIYSNFDLKDKKIEQIKKDLSAIAKIKIAEAIRFAEAREEFKKQEEQNNEKK